MKKIFTLLLMISILVSCSDWKYSNGVKRQKRNYTSLNAENLPQNELLAEKEVQIAENNADIPSENQDVEAKEPIIHSTSPSLESTENQNILVKTKLIENVDDSIKPVDQIMVNEAFDAEEKGKKSRNFGIAGLILQVTYIFGVVGLVLSIIGLIKGIQSLRADYNTPKGVKMARTGVILSSITIGIYFLSIIALLLLIIAFL